MVPLIRTASKLTLAGFLPMCALSCDSGNSSAGVIKAPSSPIPEHIQRLPCDTELSTTEGVSIVQSQPDHTRGRSILSDGYGGRTASASNAGLENIIYRWTEFEGWIYVDAELPEFVYNIEIDAPEGKTSAELARLAFETTFGLDYRESVETTNVWILERDATRLLAMEPVKSHSSNWGTAKTPGGFGYEFRAGSARDLADILGNYLDGGIVLDETGLESYYKFVLSMDHWKPETTIPAVEKLGLKVRQAKRDLPVLRIDYAK